MRKIFLPALAALCLAACSTAGMVKLNSDKAFLTAQVAFKSAQQTVLAGIKSGAITGATKAKAIALLDQGASYEAAGYAAQEVASSTGEAAAVTNLTNLLSQLTALGVLKAN